MWARRVNRLLVLALAVVTLQLAPLPESGAAHETSHGEFTDPTGDTRWVDADGRATPRRNPRADITAHGFEHGATELRFHLTVDEATDPRTDPAWGAGRSTAVGWIVSPDPTVDLDVAQPDPGAPLAVVLLVAFDGEPYTFLRAQNMPGLPDGAAECEGVGGFDPATGTYEAARFPTGCVGDADELYLGAAFFYEPRNGQPGFYYDDARDGDRLAGPVPRGHHTDREAHRLAGSGRIDTAAHVARHAFGGTAANVFLATAEDFPDALAGGVLSGGPILLVPGCGDLPQVVADTLTALAPQRVLGLGGAAAICDGMLRAAAQAAGTSHEPLRLAGRNRIETAVAVSRFELGDERVARDPLRIYLATAEDFPDALAGGSVTDGSILLVPPCGDLPLAVAEEVARVRPVEVVALGGEGAVCTGILEQARAVGQQAADAHRAQHGGPQVVVTAARLAGGNRIETAAAISATTHPFGAVEAYLATAGDFPDALAGGSLHLGPVLLVPRCGPLPDVVSAELARLNPTAVVALGGRAVVCDELLAEAVAAAEG